MAGKTAILAVKILGDAKSANRGFGSASSSAKRFGAAAARAGKIAAAALAVGVAIAARALFGMVKAAAADQKAQVLLANTLKNTTGATKKQVKAVESWISKQGVALGVTDDELRPAFARLATVTKDTGAAQRQLTFAMDIAAGSGKTLKQITEAMVKAQNGNVGSLGRLGVATKDAEGNTRRYEDILGDLAAMHEGAASKSANTFEGKMGRLKLVFDETKEAVGAKLIPVLTNLGTWFLEKGLPGIKKLSAAFMQKFGPALRAVGAFIAEKLVPAGQRFYEWFVTKIVPGVKATVTPIIEGLRKAFEKLSKKIDENRPQIEQLRNASKRFIEFIVTKVEPVIGKVLGKAFEVLGTILGTTIDLVSKLVDMFNAVVTAVGKVKDAIKGIKIPDLTPGFDLPGVPGLRSVAGAGGFALPGGSSITNITIMGAVDPNGTAATIDSLLTGRSRRLGGRGTGLGRGWTAAIA